jgi:hypothetical protein
MRGRRRDMKLFTWNTEGDFTEETKKAVVRHFFEKKECQVGFIQEGGTKATSGSIPGCKVYEGIGVGSKNERCTNYVIVHGDLVKATVPKEVGFVACGGGEAGRTAAAITIGEICLVAWHSLSGPDNSDTSALLEECAKLQGVSNVAIGGDFNAEPKFVDELIQRKLDRKRHPLATFARVCNSGKSTQKKGKELDYFVLMGDELGQLKTAVTVYDCSGISDHDVVVLDIS